MRVLHVIPSLDKEDGGPSAALPFMARSLVMQGIEVDVAATMHEDRARAQGISFGQAIEHGGWRVRFFKRQSRFYKVSLPLRSWLLNHVKDYDIVHCHGVFSFAPLVAGRTARRHGVPCIVRPLGLLNAWGMQNRRRRVKELSFRWMDSPVLNHAAAIHYTSGEEMREAEVLGLSSRAVVIPLGIDLAPFENLPTPEWFLSRHPEVRGHRLVLFLSRLDPKKGIEMLLDAFARCAAGDDDVRLVIAGDGDPDYVSSLRTKAAALGLERRVVWTGFLDGAEKLAALAAAEIFVLPSYSENFGVALLEAMAAGLPCISTNKVALAVDAGEAVRMVQPVADQLTTALAELLADGTQRKRLGDAAAAYSRSHGSLESMGTALAGLYAGLRRGSV